MIKKIIDNFIYIEICLTIVSFVSSAFTIYQSFNSENFNVIIGGITLIFAALIILITIKHTYDLKTSQYNMMEELSECFHKLNHNLRDNFFETKCLKENDELNMKFLTEKFILNVKDCINYLSDTFSNLTKKTVSVCIKIFEPIKSGNSYDENNACIRTLCRSTNTHSARIYKDKVSKISDNTDFNTIFFEGQSEFYQVDLIKFAGSNEYRNSNKLWKKQYKSTIVVPIRIQNKYLNGGDKNDYDIMGFVCIDSNSVETFKEDDIAYFVDISKSFADALYKYFKQYELYLSELEIASIKTDVCV